MTSTFICLHIKAGTNSEKVRTFKTIIYIMVVILWGIGRVIIV